MNVRRSRFVGFFSVFFARSSRGKYALSLDYKENVWFIAVTSIGNGIFYFCFDCVHYFYSNNYSKQKTTHLKIKNAPEFIVFMCKSIYFWITNYVTAEQLEIATFTFIFLSHLITHAFIVVFELYTIFDFVQVQMFDCSPRNVIEVWCSTEFFYIFMGHKWHTHKLFWQIGQTISSLCFVSNYMGFSMLNYWTFFCFYPFYCFSELYAIAVWSMFRILERTGAR